MTWGQMSGLGWHHVWLDAVDDGLVVFTDDVEKMVLKSQTSRMRAHTMISSDLSLHIQHIDRGNLR